MIAIFFEVTNISLPNRVPKPGASIMSSSSPLNSPISSSSSFNSASTALEEKSAASVYK